MAFRVMATASSEMCVECATVHKGGKRSLIDQRAVVFGDVLQAGEAVDELRGQNGIANAQRRKENLAERADVDNAPVLIEVLETRKRRAVVSELRIVVVFDDPRLQPDCALQQQKTAAKRHACTERKLA